MKASHNLQHAIALAMAQQKSEPVVVEIKMTVPESVSNFAIYAPIKPPQPFYMGLRKYRRK